MKKSKAFSLANVLRLLAILLAVLIIGYLSYTFNLATEQLHNGDASIEEDNQ